MATVHAVAEACEQRPMEPLSRIRKLSCSGVFHYYSFAIMFIKFNSEAGTFTMDGDIAVQLLKAMGHSGTVPGAILAADIPGALARLKAAVVASPKAAKPSDSDGEDGDRKEVPVSLRQRAYPLIDLLTRATAKGAQVMWAKEN